ncbi:MAG: ProQ/FINO family protein, partial [Guyparkeria sp.]|uniref:ProQ/FINO family protein n=1 Tax=Guyparkeria sp. TaxID=2035736 RepID=UPI0039795E2B
MTADESRANHPNPEPTGAEQPAPAAEPAETPAEQPQAADAGQADAPAEPQANQAKKPRVHPRDAVKQFVAAWPKAFSEDPKEVKPLAIGILQQILAERPPELEGLNSKAIRTAMKFYTSRLSYHYAMKNAEHRVDLKGEPAEPVDDKARAHADEQIKAIHAARDAKRAEQGEDENGEAKKPRRPRKAGNKPRKERQAEGKAAKPRSDKRRGQPRREKEPQPDPALQNLSLEEKLDRLAQRFGKDGAK